MAQVCRKIYNTQKEKLKGEISRVKFVALTTDIWTSGAVNGYLTVTVHYLDDSWKLSTKVLSTRKCLKTTQDRI